MLASYSKMSLAEDLEATEVPDDPWFQRLLIDYFPSQIRAQYATRLAQHALRRQIVTTVLSNDIVNRGGTTFVFRAQEETSADPAAVARAFSVVREENAGGVVERLVDYAEGVLGAVFSRRIGLARSGAFYSATGG